MVNVQIAHLAMKTTEFDHRSAPSYIPRATQASRILITSALLATAQLTSGAPVIFFGEDINPTGETTNDAIPLESTPNSDAARDDFVDILINNRIEDFESYALHSRPAAVAFGSTIATLSATNEENLKIQDARDNAFGQYAISGEKFLFAEIGTISVETITFAFDIPQTAIGFYGVDLESSEIVLTLKNGPNDQSIVVPDPSTENSGSVFYIGVIDVEFPFTEFQITISGSEPDAIAIDDLTIGTTANLSDELTIAMVAELKYFALQGVTYQLQRSDAIDHWIDLGSPVTGDGQVHVTYVPYARREFFRLEKQ